MRKRVIAIVVGAVLCVGALAVAQAPPFTVRADKITHGVTWFFGGLTLPVESAYTGNVVFEVNGVLVRADQAVMIKGGEVALVGNVRMTLPPSK